MQFVVPGVTEADSSPVHVSIIDSVPYPYWPNRTVDGNFSQNIRACLHTAALTSISEAWLRIDLKTVRSIKYVKFWYRNDSEYISSKTHFFPFKFILKIFCIKQSNWQISFQAHILLTRVFFLQKSGLFLQINNFSFVFINTAYI